MAQRFADNDKEDAHDWLLLVPQGHIYKKVISDLAGYDPTEYDGTPDAVVPAVMSWLATRSDAVQTATPKEVLAALPLFTEERRRLTEDWHDHVPWSDLLMAALTAAQAAKLVPALEQAS